MSDKKQNIHLALAAIIRDVNAVGKTRKNEQQGFKFRGIEDLLNELHPIFSAHGVLCVPFTESYEHISTVNAKGNTVIRVFLKAGYRFTASDGSIVEATALGEGLDTGDKATPKAHSMALKTVLCQTFLVPTEDVVDADAYSPTVDAAGELRRSQYDGKSLVELSAQRDQLIATKERIPAELLGKISELRADEEDKKITEAPAAEAAPVEVIEKSKRAQSKKADKPAEPAPAEEKKTEDPVLAYVLQKVPTHKGIAIRDLSPEQLDLINTSWCEKYAEKIATDPGRKADSDAIKAAIALHKK